MRCSAHKCGAPSTKAATARVPRWSAAAAASAPYARAYAPTARPARGGRPRWARGARSPRRCGCVHLWTKRRLRSPRYRARGRRWTWWVSRTSTSARLAPRSCEPFLASLTHAHAHAHTLTPALHPRRTTPPRRRGRSARGPRRRGAEGRALPRHPPLHPVAGRSRGASAAQAGAACGDARAPHGPQAAVLIPRPSYHSIATLAFCYCAPHHIPHCPPQVVKLAFRYYALAGVSNPDDNADTIAMVQFSNFCGACNLFEEEVGPNTDRRGPSRSSASRAGSNARLMTWLVPDSLAPGAGGGPCSSRTSTGSTCARPRRTEARRCSRWSRRAASRWRGGRR